MKIERHNATPIELKHYRKISIGYEAKTRFKVARPNNGLSGLHLVEEPLPDPFWIDYDALDEQDAFNWEGWDLANWQIFYSVDNNKRIGGAITASKTNGVHELEGRDDLACLFDLRVDPQHRGKGIGQSLMQDIIKWASDNRCIEIKIETDTYNLPACHFYAKIGCELRTIRKNPSPDWPDEHQLLWYLNI